MVDVSTGTDDGDSVRGSSWCGRRTCQAHEVRVTRTAPRSRQCSGPAHGDKVSRRVGTHIRDLLAITPDWRHHPSMTANEAMLLRRDRLFVATALALVGVLVLGFSYFEFYRSVGGATREAYHFGNVELLTDDPQARATVSVGFTADYPDYITDSPLLVDIALTSSREQGGLRAHSGRRRSAY